MSMRVPLIAFVTLLAVGAAAAAELEDPRTGRTVVVEPGAAALHVVFFATWCSTCVDELPGLADLEARWKGQGYDLVLIAVRTRHDAERLKEFVAEQRPPGRVLFDPEGRAESSWKASRLPTHVVFDREGGEVARASRLNEEIRAAVAGLLDPRRGGGRPR